MFSQLDISISSICLTLSLICGWRLWLSRGDAPDRSRIYLAIMDFMVTVFCGLFLFGQFIGFIVMTNPGTLLSADKSIFGLYGITLFMCYPIELMRPRQLRGRWLWLLWMPSVLVTLPCLFGLQFQELHTWSELRAHLLDWDVLLRLLSNAFVAIFSILLLVIPYSWRKSSADYHWIRQATFIAQGISVFYFGQIFTSFQIFPPLHVLWVTFSMLYFTYYELNIRIFPSPKSPNNFLTLESEPIETTIAVSAEEGGGFDFWPNICKVMDELEAWRNPNTTVETISTAVGTNRIYVARCIKAHTGKTFNDYMNEKRISYMTAQLSHDPKHDLKSLYFDAGFRNRHTAYRNFVKFIGCSPSDFISSLLS